MAKINSSTISTEKRSLFFENARNGLSIKKLPFRDYTLDGKLIARSKKWRFNCSKLRPNTKYKVYLEDEDVSAKCQLIGGKYDESTNASKLISDSNGSLVFYYFFGNEVQPRSPEESFSHFKNLEIDKTRLRTGRHRLLREAAGPNRYWGSIKVRRSG